MKRTRTVLPKISLPDAINCSTASDYTQMPNHLLRDPDLSGKAKAIIGILLSNNTGWKTHRNSLLTMMKEGKDAVDAALIELENKGYLLRIRYRYKRTGHIAGTLWAYTDQPNQFNIGIHADIMENLDLELISPYPGKPSPGKPSPGKPDTNNTNNKKEKKEEKAPTTASQFITPARFEKFWQMYPRKVNKGEAMTIWNRICNSKDRPLWSEVRLSLARQKKSERWTGGIQFIPYPTTWLRQKRWIDDASTTTSPRSANDSQTIEQAPTEMILKRMNGVKQGIVDTMLQNFKQAKQIAPQANKILLASNLLGLYEYIERVRPDGILEKNKDVRRPEYLIGEYIWWLNHEDWISNITDSTFLQNSKLWMRFLDYYGQEVGVDPIDGRLI